MNHNPLDINTDQLVEEACLYHEKLGQLYTFLSKEIPHDKAFWEALALEERQHGTWLRQLHAQMGTGSIRLDESRVRPKAIHTAIPYIDVVKQGWAQRGYTYPKVICEVSDLEQNLLDSGLFGAMIVPLEKDAGILKRLAEETKQHRLRLEEKHRVEENRLSGQVKVQGPQRQDRPQRAWDKP